jgi:hypothetical protein
VIAGDPNGNAIAAWVQEDAQNWRSVYAARYVKGTGWESPVPLETSTGHVSIVSIEIAMDPRGNAMVTWIQFVGTDERLFAARYSNVGGWSAPVPFNIGTGASAYPHLAADGAGNVTLVWDHCCNVGYDVWYSRFE